MANFNFKREIKWDKDVMKVTDSLSSIWDSIVDEMTEKMKSKQTDEVLRHFDIDMSELREYLRDKEEWKRKQAAAIPQWIPVTERLPEAEDHYLAAFRYPGSKDITYGILYYGFMDFKSEEGMCFYKYESEWGDVRYDNVTHWMKIPESPKGEDNEGC